LGSPCRAGLTLKERAAQRITRPPSPTRVFACETLTGPDLKAFNPFDAASVPRPASALPCTPRLFHEGCLHGSPSSRRWSSPN